MALTKVSGDFIQDGSITQGHLHASHGITTSDIGEGSNLYFTTARVNTAVGNLSTSDLSEGTNLYYTQARFNTAFAAKSTSDLSEGTNLYYTDTRVGSYLTTNSYATQSYVNTQVSNLVDSAPSTLDTLNELAAALGDDANFSTTVTNSIATKMPIAGGTFTGNINIGQYQLQGTSSASNFLDFDDDSTTHNPDTNVTTLASVSGIALATNLNDGGGGNFTVSTGSTGTQLLRITTAGNATFTGTITASGYNNTNWDTAYGWGNHASAGYLTSYTETDTLETVTNRGATTTNAITLSGNSNGLYFTGGNNRIYFSGYRAMEGSTTGSNLQIGEGYSLITIQDLLYVDEDIRSKGQIRATGWYNSASSSVTGHAVEIGVSPPTGTEGYILSYNRDNSTYGDLNFDAINYHFNNRSSGTFEVEGSIRTPIFYDSDNTNRYINPAGASVLYTIQSTQAQASPRWDTAFYVLQAQHWYGDSSSQTMYAGESGNDILFRGQVAIGGTAIQSGYSLTMTGAIDMNNSSIDYVHQLHFNDNVRFYEEGNNQYLNFKSGSTSLGGIIIRDGNSSIKGYIGYWDSGGYGILEGGNWWLSTPSDERYLIIGGHGGLNAYDSTTGRKLMFGGGNSDAQDNYYIGTNFENYGGNYNKLDFRWHTGIRMGAQSTYGGIRIYDSEDMGSVIFHFNVGGVNKSHTDLHAPILYDYNDTSYYLNPNGDSQFNGDLAFNSGAIGSVADGASTANQVSRIVFPQGGAGSWDSGQTGAIKIRLPIRANNNMWTMKVRIYNYNTNQSEEYLLGNYSYSTGGYNSQASFHGGESSTPKNVRFGNDGTYDCVWIGETNTTWSYPVVSVLDFQAGFRSASVSTNVDNYDISIVTSFGTVGTTISPNTKAGSVVYADSSFRSPIFYDSNNTGYYIDPNGTSQVNTIEWVNSTNNGRFFANDWGLKLQTNDGYIHFGPANTSHAHIYTDRSNFYFNQQIQLNGGSLINTNDIRAQIFYDVNSTGYYVDPSSYSNLSSGRIGSYLQIGTSGNTTQTPGINMGVGADMYWRQSTYSSNADVWIENEDATYVRWKIRVSSFDTTSWTDSIVVFNHNFWRGYVGILRSPEYPLDLNGQARLSGGYTTSDVRLKKNIRDNELGLSHLLQLRTRLFDWITDEEILGRTLAFQNSLLDCRGFIAQEVEEVVPELVDTSEGDQPTKSIDDGAVTAMMVKAIQEQQAIIDDLKARIEILENQ